MEELSELEMRILSELEEAWEEAFQTMLVTVTDCAGDQNEIEDLKQALENLVRADLVRIAVERDSSKRLRPLSMEDSLTEIAKVGPELGYDPVRKLWLDADDAGPPYGESFPYIVCTEAGQRRGFEIIDERGYQWWLQPK